MIYSVSLYNSKGKLKRSYASKTLANRHWDEFEKTENARRAQFTCVTKSTETQRILQEYNQLNLMCDGFIYDHG